MFFCDAFWHAVCGELLGEQSSRSNRTGAPGTLASAKLGATCAVASHLYAQGGTWHFGRVRGRRFVPSTLHPTLCLSTLPQDLKTALMGTRRASRPTHILYTHANSRFTEPINLSAMPFAFLPVVACI